MRKCRFLIVLMLGGLFPCFISYASDYYVDAIKGNDSYTGNIDNPWQTLNMVNSRNFLSGDVVHFHRGCTWDGSLVIDDSASQICKWAM